MTLTTVFVVYGGQVLLAFLAAPLVLRTTATMLRAPPVTFRRCLVTILVILVCSCLCAGLVVAVFPDVEPESAGVGRETVLGLTLLAVVIFFCLKYGLRTRFLGTLGIMVVWSVLSLVIWSGVTLGVRLTLLASFKLETSNMAPTLIGPHLVVRCTNCRLRIPMGVRVRRESGEFHPGRDRLRTKRFTCPNCRVSQDCSQAQVGAPDNFLVDKTADSSRWDPIVFAAPWDLDSLHVQRLVGLPGEAIEIFAGDVFADNKRLVKPPGVAEDLWITVHDTANHPGPRDASDPTWVPREPEHVWREESIGWRFETDGTEEGVLEFRRPITDLLPFNSLMLPESHPAARNVCDVMVEAEVTDFPESGHLGFDWSFLGTSAHAQVSGAGNVTLRAAERSASGQLAHPPRNGERIRFGVRDGVGFVTSGETVAATLTVFSDDLHEFRRHSRVDAASCKLTMRARGGSLSIAGPIVKRDVYYRTARDGERGGDGKPFTLAPGEHFVLGDNVALSSDSRYWREISPPYQGRYQVGTVPAELIVGTVRAISWPPERWRFFPPR